MSLPEQTEKGKRTVKFEKPVFSEDPLALCRIGVTESGSGCRDRHLGELVQEGIEFTWAFTPVSGYPLNRSELSKIAAKILALEKSDRKMRQIRKSKFETVQFSKRFPAVACAITVLHEKPFVVTAQTGPTGPRGRVTGAAITIPDGRTWVGACMCAPSDHFVRATGRAKAIGRAYGAARADNFGHHTFQDVQKDGITDDILALIREYIDVRYPR